jgi:hypothetical protein
VNPVSPEDAVEELLARTPRVIPERMGAPG